MKSIRAKLWAGMMILVGIIIVILWLFQIVFLDKFYSILEIGSVKKYGESIITEIEELTDINQLQNNKSVLERIENYGYEKQLSIEVIDSNYNEIGRAHV